MHLHALTQTLTAQWSKQIGWQRQEYYSLSSDMCLFLNHSAQSVCLPVCSVVDLLTCKNLSITQPIPPPVSSYEDKMEQLTSDLTKDK